MKNAFRSRFFHRTMLSYFCTLMIPVSVFCAVALRQTLAREKARHEAEQAAAINGAVRLVEDELEKLSAYGERLSFSPWIAKTQSLSPTLSGSIDYFRKKEICQELSVYAASLGVSNNLMLLFPERDILVTQSFWGCGGDLYYALGLSQEAAEALLEKICTSSGNRLLHLPNSEGTAGGEALLFVKRIAYSPRSSAYLLVPLNRQDMERELARLYADSIACFTLTDEEGVLLCVGNGSEEAAPHRIASGFIPAFYAVVPGLKTNYAAAVSPALLGPLCVSLAGGLLVSFLLTAVSYRPIRKILVKLGITAPRAYELAEIERILDDLIVEKRSMERKAEEYHAAACNGVVRSLLLHGASLENRQHIAELGLPLREEQSFEVILLPRRDVQSAGGAAAARQALAGAVECALAPEFCAFEELLNGSIVCVAGFPALPQTQALCFCREELRRRLPGAHPAYGLVHEGLHGIHLSYLEAQHDVFASLPAQQVRSRTESSGIYYPLDQQLTLVRQIRAGNADAVRQMLESLHAHSEQYNGTREERQLGLYIIYETLLRVVEEFRQESGTLSMEFQELQHRESTEDAWQYLYMLAENLCRKARGEQAAAQVLTGRSIVDYVECNYCNSSLSLQDISHHFGLSASRISHMFKDSVGINFIEYLQLLRVEKAKELFRRGETDILSVARRVGYESEKTFKRAFVSNAAVTPREYLKNGCAERKNGR